MTTPPFPTDIFRHQVLENHDSMVGKYCHFVCQFLMLLCEKDAHCTTMAEYLQHEKILGKWYVWKHSRIFCSVRILPERKFHKFTNELKPVYISANTNRRSYKHFSKL